MGIATYIIIFGGLLGGGYYLLTRGQATTSQLAGADYFRLDLPTSNKPVYSKPAYTPAPVKDISQQGIDFIASKEGFIPHTYIDQAGYPTIGYGHKVKSGEIFTSLTKAQARQLLEQDVTLAVAAINKYVKVALNQNQFDALTSFVFNIGQGAFARSTLLRKLNAGDYTSAAQEFERWKYITSHGQKLVSNGLVNRRNAEQQLFLT